MGRGGLTRLLAGLTALGSAGLQAQVQHQTPVPPQALFAEPLFAPRPGVIDYARHYTRTEDCLAAVERVRDSVHWGGALATGDPNRWQEVLIAFDPRQPEPWPIVQTAFRCAARFPIATADSIDLPLLEEIYAAAPDSVLDAVLAQWLALLPAEASPLERAGMARRMLSIALGRVRPKRIAWAERRLRDLARPGWVARDMRLDAYLTLLRATREVGDTIRGDRYAAAFLALFDSLRSLPETDRGRRQYGRSRPDVLEYQRERALAQGRTTEPLALYYARQAAQAGGGAVTAKDSARAVAAPAPTIEAAFWFGRSDSSAARPTRGRLNVVLFVNPECYGPCYHEGQYAVVRELGHRFGDALEITLVAATNGHFRNYPPPSPAEEAEHLRRYFLEHLKFHGALAVEVSRFSRLPAPDRRRVLQTSENRRRYEALTPIWNQGIFPHGFLIAPDGQVLFAVSLDMDDRHALMAVIAGQLALARSRSN